ncbi:class I SAM-dependent methyltransferase [Fusobacterium animalis]|uniref:class I SAM-dependent methyltransferase n=1 Tax=Fusobacterium animalis TaxID=76859 RepID=UPI0030CD5CD4
MKTEWDYTDLAEAYLKRPGYAPNAIKQLINVAQINSNSKICDIGAGAAHLTLELVKYCSNIFAIEPNDSMRNNGKYRTEKYSDIIWYEGIAENTGMPSDTFDLVTFGSSFNVCDRSKALIETKRILKNEGWFACMWNYRNLNDPLQNNIENIIKSKISNYNYGSRREDQSNIILESGLFKNIHTFSYEIIHNIATEDFIKGWESHGTVYRQAENVFQDIMSEIRYILNNMKTDYINVPYTTKVWMAQVKK